LFLDFCLYSKPPCIHTAGPLVQLPFSALLFLGGELRGAPAGAGLGPGPGVMPRPPRKRGAMGAAVDQHQQHLVAYPYPPAVVVEFPKAGTSEVAWELAVARAKCPCDLGMQRR
jgi:hypothetical protein